MPGHTHMVAPGERMLILPQHLRSRMVRNGGDKPGLWYGRYGILKSEMRLRPEDVTASTYPAKVDAYLQQTPEAWQKVVTGTWPSEPVRPLTIPESLSLIKDGLETNIQRNGRDPSKHGIMFARVAGQALMLENPNARSEIRRILSHTLKGGVFVVIGHGGKYACGAVAAKKALEQGADLSAEHQHTQSIVKCVADIDGLESPAAEWFNAMVQARKLMKDEEFGQIIRERGITVAYTVAVNEEPVFFQAANRDLSREELYALHPKLPLLAGQLEKGIITAGAEDKGRRHFAHATVISDPLDLFGVITPHLPGLEVGGICCVDARLANNTTANIVRAHVGETFFATGEFDSEGRFHVDAANGGSMSYAWRHVAGVDILRGDGSTGNGHIVAIASNPDRATALVQGLQEYDDVKEILQRGGSITTITFDGHTAHISNEQSGYSRQIVKTN